MVSSAIDIRLPDAELTRTGLELKQLSQAWQHKPRGAQFTNALLTFLGSKKNQGTRKLYAFSILEFFAWYDTHRGRIPLPNEVIRADTHLFSQYLQTRTIGLDEYRLEQDPERKLDLEIYRFIKQNAGTTISNIRRHLLNDYRFTTEVTFTVRGIPQRMRVLELEAGEPRGDHLDDYVAAHGRRPPNNLDLHLACLCEHNLLRRTPTVQQIRERFFSIDEPNPTQAQILYRVDPEIFRYSIISRTETQGVERSKTIASRLSALASFWRFLITQSSENLPGTTEQLIQHNIWLEPRAEVSKKAIKRGKARRELRTPNRDLFLAVLATTFRASHGDAAREAANAAIEGADVRGSATGKPSLLDVRDRAALLFVYWTGVRSEEMASLRRSDLDMRSGLVTLIGKGEETRSFVVPQPALLALQELQNMLEDWRERSKPEALVHALTEPQSPLLPPIKLWGHAARDMSNPGSLSGIEKNCFLKMLRSRAEMAGIERKSADWYKLHPHGLRHLAALEANSRGIDVATIQATLGHASLATTGIYLEVRNPLDRSLMPQRHAAPITPHPVIIDAPTPKPVIRERDIVLEKAPPPESTPIVAPAEHLEPSHEAILLAEESDAVQFLLAEYKNNWGEKNRHTKLDLAGKGVLAHTYVGKQSGLAWWAGATGEMMDSEFSYTPNRGFPSMPVVSPGQFLGAPGSGVCSQTLCRALSKLYERWVNEPNRGPTAASALSQWVYLASRITLEANQVIEERDGAWVRFEDPLSNTAISGQPNVLREHLDDAIVAWFEATAWQYRPTANSLLMTRGDLEIPEWYGETDPIAAIPEKERRELLDWLQVLVGLPPRDPTPRYQGKSRAALGKVLSAMCTYEKLATDKTIDSERQRKEYLAAAEADIQKQVASLTGDRFFSYGQTKESRHIAKLRSDILAERAKTSGTIKAHEEFAVARAEYDKRLAPHFMNVLAKLVGSDVKNDPVLNLFALCTSGVPLDSGERAQLEKYKNLFRVIGNSIEHTPAFAIQFARDTGQHSECVARRIARHIYDEGKLGSWYKQKKWSDTTLAYLEAMSAYRVPCPGKLEEELRDRLATEGPLPVFEQWQKAERGLLSAQLGEEPLSEAEEVRLEEEERAYARPTAKVRDLTPNSHRISLSKQTRAARRYLPNTMAFLPIVFGRGAR